MKKQAFFGVGIIVIAISCFSDLALSLTNEGKWSHYSQEWNVKLHDKKVPEVRTASKPPDITICDSNLSTKKSLKKKSGPSKKKFEKKKKA